VVGNSSFSKIKAIAIFAQAIIKTEVDYQRETAT